MSKEARSYDGGKMVSLTNDAEKTGQLHGKINKLDHSLCTKISSKWIKDINVGPDTVKLHRKTQAEHSDINCNNIFLDLSPRVIEIKTKINKWDGIKLKSFCTAKESINKTKRQPTQ